MPSTCLATGAKSGETLVEAGSDIEVQMIPWGISQQFSSGLLELNSFIR